MKLKYLYDSSTGNIMGKYSDNVNINGCLYYASEEYKQSVDYIISDINISNFRNYKVSNNQLIKRPQQEIEELQRYHRILSNEERLLNRLKPPAEEIQKAEQTIEILTLIQEVM